MAVEGVAMVVGRAMATTTRAVAVTGMVVVVVVVAAMEAATAVMAGTGATYVEASAVRCRRAQLSVMALVSCDRTSISAACVDCIAITAASFMQRTCLKGDLGIRCVSLQPSGLLWVAAGTTTVVEAVVVVVVVLPGALATGLL